jgi:D-aminopeptidase
MRKPLHELKIHGFFYYKRGKFNAITDVQEIKVGHTTIIKGSNVRTGVTVIIPPDLSKNRYIAGGFAFNANGEVTGLQYIFEEARLTSPIFLTNTVSVGDVFSAVVDYYKGEIALPIVGECWDGYLNDIWGRHVKKEHVFQAIKKAKSGKVEQGCVGAGTGMTSFGFKSGIGTASRKVKILGKEYTVGVLVNNNMGNEDGRHRYLRIGGIDVAKTLGENAEVKEIENIETHQSSSILVVAIDAPLTHYQLNRIAKHAVLGFARIGLVSYSGSGDFIIAFSTGNKLPKRESKVKFNVETIEESLLDDIFEATLEAVEEAYLNTLLTAEDMKGRNGHVVHALPVDKLIRLLK